MDLENRIKAYRFVAYSAVTFSVVAVLSVCVTLPMVYNYVHHVRRQMHSEITYCKVSCFSLNFSTVNRRNFLRDPPKTSGRKSINCVALRTRPKTVPPVKLATEKDP
jgi:hypothetical protein